MSIRGTPVSMPGDYSGDLVAESRRYAALCIDLEREYCVGLEINANHVRPARAGHVHATARPIHLGRATHIWDIRIRDDAGELVCIARLTMMIKAGRAQVTG